MNCSGRCSVTNTVPLPSFLRVLLNVLRQFKLLKIWALSMALDSFTIIGLVTLAPCRDHRFLRWTMYASDFHIVRVDI